MLDDATLLRRYLEDRSQAAFTELVQRHLSLVYHAARRQTGNPQMAEDVVQTVFADLVRKAPSLLNRSSLAGWLHTSTRFASIQMIRSEQRRQAREQTADLSGDRPGSLADEATWSTLQPQLDAALADLAERDREVVILRCLETRPFAEIAARLSISEDAARMRVERALDKLRRAFARRGITSTATALATCLADCAAGSVPVGLAANVTAASLALPITAVSTTGISLIAFMTSKTIVSGIAVLAAGVALHQFQSERKTRLELESAQQNLATAQAKLAETQKDLVFTRGQLRAAEEEGSTLLTTLDRAAEKLAQGEEPVRITHDYVLTRWKRAQELAKTGSPDEALKELLWCFDEGMVRVRSFSGVRSSYLLSRLADLGKTFPPALIELRKRRDEAEKIFRASSGDYEAFSDFANINQKLGESSRTLELYDQIPPDDKRKPLMGSQVFDQLKDSRRYQDALQARPFTTMNRLFDASVAVRSDNSAAAQERSRNAIPHHVGNAAGYVEVLAGSGNLDNARTLAQRILAYDNSPQTLATLVQAATRAGHPHLLTDAPSN